MGGNSTLLIFTKRCVKITRIIHIWDQAGISAILAKYQRNAGHDVKVFKKTGWDPYKILEYYGEKTWDGEKIEYARECMYEPKGYDIIHVHDLWQIIPLLRLFYPKKTIILHYHGTILRNCKKWKRIIAEKCASKVLVATKDLLKYGSDFIYVPNPVDTELFDKKLLQDCGCVPEKNNMASIVIKADMTINAVKSLLMLNDINVKLDARQWKEQKLPYAYMPKNLLKNEFFLDIFMWKGGLMDAHSTAGLQAMAIGVPTLCSDFKWRDSLPEEHKPNNVVNMLDRIYETECLKHNSMIKKQLDNRIHN